MTARQILFAAALLAASNSPALVGGDIGKFFDIPEWMPDTLEQQDTQGADVLYGEKTTVRVPSAWVIYRDGVVTNVPSPVLVDTGTTDPPPYFDVSQSHELGETVPAAFTNAGRITCFDILDLSWKAERRYDSDVYYRAVGTNFVSFTLPRAYVRHKPTKASATVYASLIAAFEAYYERLYYASQGESNAWSVSEWGPLSPSPNFVFCPTNKSASNVYDYIPLPLTNDAGTVRSLNPLSPSKVVSQRKMDEVENLYALRDAVVKMCKDNSRETKEMNYSAAFRPGWLSDCESFGSSVVFPFWWSSRGFGNPDSVVPTFGWAFHDSFVAQVGDSLKTRAYVIPSHVAYGSFTHEFVSPLSILNESCNIGSLPSAMFAHQSTGSTFPAWFTNFYPNCYASYSVEPSMSISYAFGSDRDHKISANVLASVNQALSLMDRTIQVPKFASLNDTRLCQVRQKTEQRYEDAHYRLRWDDDAHMYAVDYTLKGSLSSSSRSNEVSVTENAGCYANRVVLTWVKPTYDSISSKASFRGSVGGNFQQIDLETVRALLGTLVFQGESGIATAWFSRSENSRSVLFVIQSKYFTQASTAYELPEMVLADGNYRLSFEADYEYSKTVLGGPSTVLHSQTGPGIDAGDRVASCRLGFLSSAIFNDDHGRSSEALISYSDELNTPSAYRLVDRGWSASDTSLSVKYLEELQAVNDYLQTLARWKANVSDVEAANDVIWIPEIDHDATPSSQVTIGLDRSWEIMYENFGMADENITWRESVSTNSFSAFPLYTSILVSGTADIPVKDPSDERKSFRVNGSTGAILQIDWDWKNMSRQ